MAKLPILVSFLWGKSQRQGLCKVWKFVTPLILMICFINPGTGESCSLPKAWNGYWFINEFANGPPIIINSTTNTISRRTPDPDAGLGHCVWNKGDFYIFKNSESGCNRCVLITSRHKNALYSREAYDCQKDSDWKKDGDDPEALCRELINSFENENRYFWFKKTYEPINCPFGKASFQFSYSKSGGALCESRVSHASSCLDSTKMELVFQACPDNANSIGKVEQLTCVGEWEENGHRLLLVDVTGMNNRGHQSLQERFRCFTYKENTIPNPLSGKLPIVTGYDIGTSDSATCIGMHSPEHGETIIHLRKENPTESEEKHCMFPTWLANHNWIDMGKSVEFEMQPQTQNRIIHIRHTEGHNRHVPKENGHQMKNSFFPLSHSSLACLQKRNVSGGNSDDADNSLYSHVAVVAKYTVGCKIDEICLHLIQRDEYIFQMYYLESSTMDRNALREKCFNSTYEQLSRGATMISTRGTMKPCPNPGKYMPQEATSSRYSVNQFPGLTANGEWFVGCNDSTDVVPSLTRSENDVDLAHFSCMDGWDDPNSTFTLISLGQNGSKHSNLYCMKSSKDSVPTLPQSGSVLVTSQDCIHISENDTPTDNEIGSSHPSSAAILEVQLYRTADCSSTAVDGNIDQSNSTTRSDFLQHGGSSTDSSNNSISSSPCVAKMIPVYIIMTLLAVRFVVL